MFSVEEKRKIASAVEKVLLELNHPEMPRERPIFKLHIKGIESWSWADIEPNWIFDKGVKKQGINPWNEQARDILK